MYFQNGVLWYNKIINIILYKARYYVWYGNQLNNRKDPSLCKCKCFDFEIAKLLAVRADFLQTIKRLGNHDLYKSYQEKAKNIVSKEELLAEIDKLSQTLKGKGLDMYADYAKRTLEATKESFTKTCKLFMTTD